MESARAIGNLRGTLLRVIDVNGIVGYGFVIEHGGLEQLSVSWPDRVAERFTQDMCERHKIHTEIVFPEFDPEVIENDQSEPSNAGNTPIPGDSGSTIVENADSIELPSTELASTGIPGVNILTREGFKTIGDVKKYITENGSLIPVKGIGEKLNAEIFDFLTKTST